MLYFTQPFHCRERIHQSFHPPRKLCGKRPISQNSLGSLISSLTRSTKQTRRDEQPKRDKNSRIERNFWQISYRFAFLLLGQSPRNFLRNELIWSVVQPAVCVRTANQPAYIHNCTLLSFHQRLLCWKQNIIKTCLRNVPGGSKFYFYQPMCLRRESALRFSSGVYISASLATTPPYNVS
jgi:hypothetical protein